MSSRLQRRTGDVTRAHILDTAQRLFVTRGLDAVSLNEIVQEAGVNTAAIHYHFGSKDGLVEAILRRGADSWGSRRGQILDELEAQPEISLREVVVALVQPVADISASPWAPEFEAFVAAVSMHESYSRLSVEVTSGYTDRFLAALRRAVPGLPEVVLLRRFAYARSLVFHTLVSTHAIDLWLTARGVVPPPNAVDDLVDLLAGGLAAPVRDEPAAAGAAGP